MVVEDDLIKIAGCDMTAAKEKFKRTLIGRMFYTEGRSIGAIISLLPKVNIWDVEGRTHGVNLGNGRFQFDFDKDEYMNKVLAKRPWHFNRWSFSLEPWEPFTSELFPNTMVIWVRVKGVPVHFWNDVTFTEIRKAQGNIRAIEAQRSKLQVSINTDAPLQFEIKLVSQMAIRGQSLSLMKVSIVTVLRVRCCLMKKDHVLYFLRNRENKNVSKELSIIVHRKILTLFSQ